MQLCKTVVGLIFFKRKPMSTPTPIPPEIPFIPDPTPEINPGRIVEPEIPPPIRDPEIPLPMSPEIDPQPSPPEVPVSPS